MCIFNNEIKSNETKNSEIEFCINYNDTYFCCHNKKRHLVLCGTLKNMTKNDITITINFSQRCKLKKNIAKPNSKTTIYRQKIYENRPKIIAHATITDEPHTIKAETTEPFTIIANNFNINNDLTLLADYGGGQLIKLPIQLGKIENRNIQ